eukprot:TRINITY_DN9786_c0_g1_i1.p2 TRINITY_DN9786_c0_g1~~TRINITY_DN9786_c0_g1_i1.p2  ORF type:complete len:106 (+),score=19.75 TRINITY_DN9786_c0_g1_i1:97-414(+)
MHINLFIINENVNNLQGDHLADLFLAHASFHKLILRHLSIFILVHLCKCSLCNQVLGSNIWILSLKKAIHVLDQLVHLLDRNDSITVHIKHTEYLGYEPSSGASL